MEGNRVINIINFVRGCEPRFEADLMTPIIEEIKLNKKYGFDNTFLLQYDAMARIDMVDLFQREKDEHMELGIWIEMSRELVENVGIDWRGRWDWDWYVNPGFLLAYTKKEKQKIIDLIMSRFKELFGYYPKSAGSWVLDSDSIMYMVQKYKLDAFCICREQWGTDGYTLWGGYYNGPYYPSKNHILHPAQTKEMQIEAPVFRMLGPDPIYCYSEKIHPTYDKNNYELYTLEPAWNCGQSEKWVEWYFRNLYRLENMDYTYTQVGQENSFGWKKTVKGLPMQMEHLKQLVDEGKFRVEKLCDSGKKFKETFVMTPASAYSALDDWAGNDNQSVWYSCNRFRLNLFSDEQGVWIRDLHKFDENCKDIYLEKPCEESASVYDTLPVVDGLRFGEYGMKCGIYIGEGKISTVQREKDKFVVHLMLQGREVAMHIDEASIVIKSDEEFHIEFIYKKDCLQVKKILEKKIEYLHNGVSYYLYLEKGFINGNHFHSEGGKIVIRLE